MINMVSGVVLGQPQRKDNRRMIVKNRRTVKPMVIKSREALTYVQSFDRQIMSWQRAGYVGPVEVKLIMYYRNNRSDLPPELIPELIFDCLQKVGVFKNDRQIVRCVMEKRIDKENPRVAWAVREISQEENDREML